MSSHRDVALVRDRCLLRSAVVFTALIVAACFFIEPVRGSGPPGSDPRILVITDTTQAASNYSKLLESLKVRGYDLTIKSGTDVELSLNSDGQYSYGGLLLLCPTSKAVARSLPLAEVERFIDAGLNVFVAAGPSFSDYTQSIAQAVGVDLDDRSALVIDHQRVFRQLDDGSATFIRAGGHVKSPFLFGAAADLAAAGLESGDIVYRGPGAQLFVDNELVDSVIWGSGSSYSYNPATLVTTSPHASGTATVLGAALDTRAGGRVGYFGSIDALADDVLDAAGGVHEAAVTSFVAWAFGNSGVLRTQNLQYKTPRPGWETDGVRVKDVIDFSIEIHAWNGDFGQWVDYVADDVQLEFVMLNPWVRTRLQYTGHNGTYTAKVPVPDQIGIYKFSIAYYRAGVSNVVVEQVVPVRPFLHNEYPRFIRMAYPYYVSSFLMLAVVFILGLLLMFGNPKLEKQMIASETIRTKTK